MKKYLVRVRFPAEFQEGVYVTWIEVNARTEKEAEHKARIKASKRIKLDIEK